MPATLRLHNVHVPYGAGAAAIRRAAAAKLNVAEADLPDLTIARRSIDTRERPRIRWSLAIELDGEPSLIAHLPANEASVVVPVEVEPLVPGTLPLSARPVVVGAGPAGLFAALTLAERGYAPVVVERGREVARRDMDVEALMRGRRVNPESNFLFGEGGAGAYSDGKLTTRTGDPRLEGILDALIECGAPEEILIDARPHIGSDLLPGIISRLRRRIEALGGRFRFEFKVASLALAPDGSVEGVVSSAGEVIRAGAVILAPGNSARDLIRALYAQGVAVEARPFQVGVRIEHPQEIIDHAVYGRKRGELPAAEYIISSSPSKNVKGMASFCMCPGGIIVPAVSEPERLSTNGMSRSGRDGRFANVALVATVDAADVAEYFKGAEKGQGPLAGMEFQEALEEESYRVGRDYHAPAQKAADFLAGGVSRELPDTSYPLGVVPADLRGILPAFLVAALERALPQFDRKLPGFIESGLLVAVESRVSAPIRIARDRGTFESTSTKLLFPAGEGAGYAGGIMSSAVDGIKAAEAIIRRFAP